MTDRDLSDSCFLFTPPSVVYSNSQQLRDACTRVLILCCVRTNVGKGREGKEKKREKKK